MKLLMAFTVMGILLALPIYAQEAVVLTTPVVQPSIASYTPGSLHIDVVPSPRIVVTIIGTDGKGQVFEYPCANACVAGNTPAKVQTMINGLNTANLTTRSLWRRVFDRLVLDFPERFVGGAAVP